MQRQTTSFLPSSLIPPTPDASGLEIVHQATTYPPLGTDCVHARAILLCGRLEALIASCRRLGSTKTPEPDRIRFATGLPWAFSLRRHVHGALPLKNFEFSRPCVTAAQDHAFGRAYGDTRLPALAQAVLSFPFSILTAHARIFFSQRRLYQNPVVLSLISPQLKVQQFLFFFVLNALSVRLSPMHNFPCTMHSTLHTQRPRISPHSGTLNSWV